MILLIKILQTIRPHFKPVLQEILVWATPQTKINVLACLGEEKATYFILDIVQCEE